MTTHAEIDDFLSRKRLAIVGVSRNPQDFTRSVLREFLKRGYDMVPVNPGAEEMEGRPCFARLQDVTPPVEGALVMTSPSVTDKVVWDCAEAGIKRVWMHRGAGVGAVSPSAVAFCKAQDIKVVEGECPFMFLPEAAWIHRAHGFCRKVMGRYPG
jgi:predicted CoA-binding protein